MRAHIFEVLLGGGAGGVTRIVYRKLPKQRLYITVGIIHMSKTQISFCQALRREGSASHISGILIYHRQSSCTFFIHSVVDLLILLLCTFEQVSDQAVQCGTPHKRHHDTTPQDTHSTTWIYVLALLHGNIVHLGLISSASLWHSFSYLGSMFLPILSVTSLQAHPYTSVWQHGLPSEKIYKLHM